MKLLLFSTVFSLSNFFIFLQFWKNFDSEESNFRKSLFLFLSLDSFSIICQFLKWDYCYSLQSFPCRASSSFYNFGKILTRKSQIFERVFSYFYLWILWDNLLILVKIIVILYSLFLVELLHLFIILGKFWLERVFFLSLDSLG